MDLFRCLTEALHQDLNRIPGQQRYEELRGEGEPTQVAAEWWRYYCARDDSLVTDLFRGQLFTILKCGSCKAQTYSADIFLDLPVTIADNGSCTLPECLNEFNRKERIDDYKCEKCRQQTQISKQMWIYKLPKILVVHLKRFTHTSYMREKLGTTVYCPE